MGESSYVNGLLHENYPASIYNNIIRDKRDFSNQNNIFTTISGSHSLIFIPHFSFSFLQMNSQEILTRWIFSQTYFWGLGGMRVPKRPLIFLRNWKQERGKKTNAFWFSHNSGNRKWKIITANRYFVYSRKGKGNASS